MAEIEVPTLEDVVAMLKAFEEQEHKIEPEEGCSMETRSYMCHANIRKELLNTIHTYANIRTKDYGGRVSIKTSSYCLDENLPDYLNYAFVFLKVGYSHESDGKQFVEDFLEGVEAIVSDFNLLEQRANNDEWEHVWRDL